jgi:molecular chaperone GrpE
MHNEPNIPDNPTSEATDLSGEAQLQEELSQLQTAMTQIRDEVLRERAELDNQRKRLARDVDQARKFANERLLSELLPVLDSLEAGLAASQDETGKLREGMELTQRQLLKVGHDNGMTQINPMGDIFNPEWHQAISQMQVEGAAENTVVQVFQKGYLLNERLLRPALVVVAKTAD